MAKVSEKIRDFVICAAAAAARRCTGKMRARMNMIGPRKLFGIRKAVAEGIESCLQFERRPGSPLSSCPMRDRPRKRSLVLRIRTRAMLTRASSCITRGVGDSIWSRLTVQYRVQSR